MILQQPLVSRKSGILVTLGVVRISTPNQQEMSLEDQKALLNLTVGQVYSGRTEWHHISTRASGEWLDREELSQIREMVKTRNIDLVIAEDLGRLIRDVEVLSLCGYCIDHGTRVVAINDRLDTADPGWRQHGMFAAMHHEMHNEDTSRRIKQRLGNRFETGNLPPRLIAGYKSKANPKTAQDVSADPDATVHVREVAVRLERGARWSEIADFLNAIKFPVGPTCRADKWNGPRAKRWFTNPMIGGVCQRNRRHTVKHYTSGHRKSVKAPASMLKERYYKHLEHLPRQEHERLVRLVEKRNTRFKRAASPSDDPLSYRPRKRTRFPGQSCYCWVCGNMFVWGGHGQKDHLMCSGARMYQCWNAASFDGLKAARLISAAVFEEMQRLTDFEPAFKEIMAEQAGQIDQHSRQKICHHEQQVDVLNRQLGNLEAQIMDGYQGKRLKEKYEALEAELQRHEAELFDLNREAPAPIDWPSVERLQSLARERFMDLAVDDLSFADQMRILVPRTIIRPYRCIDGGDVVLRAKVTIHLANLIPDKRLVPIMDQPLQRSRVIDLFEPPQRVAYRQRIVEVRQQMTERQAAAQLGLTVAAAQHAAKLQRWMEEHGVADPYVPLAEPPDDCGRFRRHKHSRYSFQPLETSQVW